MKASVALPLCLVISWLSSEVRGQQRDAVCANVPHGRFVRGSESCKAYNYCANGVAYPGTCPTSLSFNANTEICDRVDRVDCIQCSSHGVQQIADPRDCSKFYRCARGVRSLRQCPAGLMFDPRLGDCNVDASSACQVQVSICAQFAELGLVLVGNPNDCSRYYLAFGRHSELQCECNVILDIFCASTEPSRIFNADHIHITTHRLETANFPQAAREMDH